MFQGTIREIIAWLLDNFDLQKMYTIAVQETKLKRSLQQNKLLWTTIHKIAKKTMQDDYDIYISLLEDADAASDYVMTRFDDVRTLQKSFRAVKFVIKQEVDGEDWNVYKVWLGSSKLTTEQCSELLHYAEKRAIEEGVLYG